MIKKQIPAWKKCLFPIIYKTIHIQFWASSQHFSFSFYIKHTFHIIHIFIFSDHQYFVSLMCIREKEKYQKLFSYVLKHGKTSLSIYHLPKKEWHIMFTYILWMQCSLYCVTVGCIRYPDNRRHPTFIESFPIFVSMFIPSSSSKRPSLDMRSAFWLCFRLICWIVGSQKVTHNFSIWHSHPWSVFYCILFFPKIWSIMIPESPKICMEGMSMRCANQSKPRVPWL